jgi:hypothetical protein
MQPIWFSFVLLIVGLDGSVGLVMEKVTCHENTGTLPSLTSS